MKRVVTYEFENPTEEAIAERIKEARKKKEEAQLELEATIQEAKEAGFPVRMIGELAGYSGAYISRNGRR